MKVIVYTNDVGGVSVCTPTGEIPVETVKMMHTPAESIIIDSESLPSADNDFFNAWQLDGESVTVNLDKAKEITKMRLRFEREPFLKAQDVAFQRALEIGADTSAIVAEKQRLRDITNQVDACSTTDELRALKVEA